MLTTDRSNGWYWYITENAKLLERHKCGKWMYFFEDQEFALRMCKKAILENICYECKCTDLEYTLNNSGVLCFFLNCDDIDNHRRVIQFMMDNDLIKKCKNGRLHNISFKLNDQTYAGEYGASFEGSIKLENFVDIYTGKWLE